MPCNVETAASHGGPTGCWSQGETEQEAMQNIRDAIEDYLAAVNEGLRGSDVREVEVSV